MIGRFLGPLQLLLCLWVCFVNITPFVYQGWLEAWLVSMGHGTIAAVALLCAIHDQVCAVASSGMPITLLLGVVVSCCSVHIVVVATALFCPFWDIFPCQLWLGWGIYFVVFDLLSKETQRGLTHNKNYC